MFRSFLRDLKRTDSGKASLYNYHCLSLWQTPPTHETTACWCSIWPVETHPPGMPCSAIEKVQARGRGNGGGTSSREEEKVNWEWKNWEDRRLINFLWQLFQLKDSLCITVNHFLSFFYHLYKSINYLVLFYFHKICLWVLFARTHGHNTSEYGWKAYPDKHVKFRFTPFLKFFYLHLACMANIQVVNSWPPSVPAGSGPHFASINREIELILQPTRQQFFGIIVRTCCKDDPTRSVAALLLSHQWMLLCWVVHLMETAIWHWNLNILEN